MKYQPINLSEGLLVHLNPSVHEPDDAWNRNGQISSIINQWERTIIRSEKTIKTDWIGSKRAINRRKSQDKVWRKETWESRKPGKA